MVGCMIQETYDLVPVPHVLLVKWTSSKTEPWSILLVERVVGQLSIRSGRSMLLDCMFNFVANQVEGFIFGKPLESRFISWEWAEVWGHFVEKLIQLHFTTLAIPLIYWLQVCDYQNASVHPREIQFRLHNAQPRHSCTGINEFGLIFCNHECWSINFQLPNFVITIGTDMCHLQFDCFPIPIIAPRILTSDLLWNSCLSGHLWQLIVKLVSRAH